MVALGITFVAVCGPIGCPASGAFLANLKLIAKFRVRAQSMHIGRTVCIQPTTNNDDNEGYIILVQRYGCPPVWLLNTQPPSQTPAAAAIETAHVTATHFHARERATPYMIPSELLLESIREASMR